MTLRQRYEGILGYFRDNVPVAASELHFDSPYQLLVATMLSAQCTDKRVNMTTPALFAAYPTPQALSLAGFEDVLALIRSISYPNRTGNLQLSANSTLPDCFWSLCCS